MAVTRLTGTQTKAIYKLGKQNTAFGTALAAGAGDRIRGAISTNYQAQELTKNPLGSGLTMQDDIIKGRITPVISLSMDVGFRNGADRLAAQFFSTSAAPAEQNAGEGDYLHSFTMNSTANNIYGTFAYELTSAKVAELPSCACRSFQTSFGGTNEILQAQVELLGNDLELATSVNTNAVISASTNIDSECVIVKLEDQFWLNAESDGALDSGDQYDITSYTRVLSRPQEFSGQVKGSAGNPAPLAGEIISGTLSVVIEALDDISKFDSWNAGDTFKCALIVEGSQIGAGDNKTWAEYTPRIKLVQAPKYNITDAGYNSVMLDFVILQATTAPTGMASTLPYLQITNEQTTNYILAS